MAFTFSYLSLFTSLELRAYKCRNDSRGKSAVYEGIMTIEKNDINGCIMSVHLTSAAL